MLPILCPRCQVRVLPSPEGICPGCRQVILMPATVIPGALTKACPQCQAPMAENAVLCVACGFHQQRDRFLGTVVERQPLFTDNLPVQSPVTVGQPVDSNPYASPAILNENPDRFHGSGEMFIADLTPEGAKRARAIVDDAGRVYWVIFLSLCICRIAWLLMFPWYGYRLYSWYVLNRTYSELRNPTPRLSAHYGLALDFQAAKGKVWAGFIVGAIAFFLYFGVLLLAALSEAVQDL
jgi:hypothetical protein